MIEVDGDYFRMRIEPMLKSIGAKVAADEDFAGDIEQDEVEEGRAESIPEGTQRLIEGYASTPVRDMQGEMVEPLGLDLSYFAKHGRINWDHGKDPASIIGQPFNWRLSRKGLWLRALLYQGVSKADDAFNLFRAGAQLAWSVEGKVTERDRLDPTHILRAYVINVALTPNPVCQETFAVLAKSMLADTDAELSKTLTTASAAVLIGQSLEGDDHQQGEHDAVLKRHIAKALGLETPICGCISRSQQAGTFVKGYRGALSHFFGCCGASPEQASELAGKHERIARATGILLRGE